MFLYCTYFSKHDHSPILLNYFALCQVSDSYVSQLERNPRAVIFVYNIVITTSYDLMFLISNSRDIYNNVLHPKHCSGEVTKV